MSEHVRNVRPAWTLLGWFLAAALAAVVLVGLAALDLVRLDAPVAGVWVAVALVVGFVVGGFYVGTRVAAAPFLNGVALGLTSLVAWLAVNLVAGATTGVTAWDSLDTRRALSLVLLQTVSAVLGTRAGVRWARRGIDTA